MVIMGVPRIFGRGVFNFKLWRNGGSSLSPSHPLVGNNEVVITDYVYEHPTHFFLQFNFKFNSIQSSNLLKS